MRPRPADVPPTRPTGEQPPTGARPTVEGAVGRRTLLTGLAATAGVLLGGGAVEAAHAASSHARDTGPRPPTPGEELMTEHGVLKRVLLAYDTIAEHLRAGEELPPRVVQDAAQIVADYVESFHEGLEEAYVFPRVAPARPRLIATLLQQHDRGRHLTAAVLALAGGDLGEPASRTALAAHLSSFTRMYAPHEAWEDTVVYPALREQCSQRVLDELADRFADLENAQYGDAALASMLDRVSGIEQQLGIHDLSLFTPPPLPLPPSQSPR